MPKMKLTKRAIEKLAAPGATGKQVLYWDEDLKGFGVLVSGTTTAKTYIVQRKLPNGLTRRLTIGPTNVFEIEAARDQAIEKLAELCKGVDPKAEKRKGTKVTLRWALDNYLIANKELREQSRHYYRNSIERWMPEWLDRPLIELTPEKVQERHMRIKEDVERRATAGAARRGNATANAAMKTLRLVYNFAADRYPDLPRHPVRLRRQWFPVDRRERHVRGDDLPKFYAAVCALPNRTASDYLQFLLFTGLRRTEAAALKWSEIDFAERVIRLPASRTKAGRKLDLPMTDYLRDLLVARRALGRDGEYVFPSPSKAGFIANPDFPLTQVALACGVRVSAHDLRRTFITAAAATDIPAAALKGLANHALGSDVTDGYIQLTVAMLREPAQKVCDRLKELCGIGAIGGENVEKLA